MTTSNGIEPANPSAETRQSAVGEAPGMAVTVIDEAAPAGEQTACARTDGFEHDPKTGQDTLEIGLNPATQTFQRITDQMKQVLGLNGSEAEEQTRRASQNLQAVTQASTVLVRGAQEVSQEVFGLIQDRLQKNVDAMNRITGTRSVQDFVAVQSDLARDTLWQVIDTNKRIAGVSVRVAEEAARIIQVQADKDAKQVRRAA